MNEFDEEYQFRSCQKLLSAVIALAIEDAQLEPLKIGPQRTPRDEAVTAIRFLFTDDSDGYLAALDIDPQQFRKRLMNEIYSDKKGAIRNARAMKFNYQFVYKNYSALNWNSLHREYPAP